MKVLFFGAASFFKDKDETDGITYQANTHLASDFSVDSSKYVIFPGFVDVHVHFREPGFSYKETIMTGSLSAAHGGFTTVCTMPNLNPVPDCYDNLKPQLDLIRKAGIINVIPYGSITRNESGKELSDMKELSRYVCGFSDDGKGVDSYEIMLLAMKEAKGLGKIIAAHCEDYSQIKDSKEAEWKEIERDIKIADLTGCKFHVCHISTKESVSLIRDAKKSGVDISCETAPHYLTLSEKDIRDDGGYRMNPPLRGEEDREALIEGLCDGTIDMIATDHAPHSREEKSKGLKSLNGIVGLECSFPILYTKLVKNNVISLEKLIELMSLNPARRFGFEQKNCYCVYSLDEQYRINPEQFASMGRSTPFKNEKVFGKCIATICNGKLAYIDSGLIDRS